MKWALIVPQQNNRIAQVENEQFPVAPPLYWVDCEDDVDLSWSYENKKFVPPITKPIETSIPRVVSMRQARLALLANKDLQRIDTIIKGSPEAVQVEWEYAATVDRDSDLVKGLAIVLGYSETTLDQLFLQASRL